MKPSTRYGIRTVALAVACAVCHVVVAAESRDALSALESRLPQRPEGFDDASTADVERLAAAVERQVFAASRFGPATSQTDLLGIAGRVLAAGSRVDKVCAGLLDVRTQFIAAPAGEARRQQVRNFLRQNAKLVDLSGRVRYLSFDVLGDIAAELSNNESSLLALTDRMIAEKSSVGAAVMAPLLFDSPGSSRGSGAVSIVLKQRILQLIRESGQYALDDELARLVRQRGAPPPLVLAAAETLRAVGLPQEPRPGVDPTLPKPEITAASLHKVIAALDPVRLGADDAKRRETLLAWLDVRRRRGVVEESYRLGRMDLRAGDWLLMRNPSPYNLFTDLSPGLYTHVGVVAVETDTDGMRRFVVVDLPERGNVIPATPVDTFVKRTLNFTVLRESDPTAAGMMARAAAAVIGNPSQFDLRFRTAGIETLKGRELRGTKIEGYCAGLLLLCAQETNHPRSRYFPLSEHPAGGNTLDNLAKLEISMGEDFLSPTGPLFSSHLKVVGGRDPLYDPRREIEQAVYDHFADGMMRRKLKPSPDWYYSLRESLASASRGNPLLAKALANAAGVNENIDLVAAAKLGAVVEVLDEIAYGASGEFRKAREAIMAVEPRGPRRGPRRPQQDPSIALYRNRHAELVRAWQAERLTPRQLREQLVAYYIAFGKRQLDERFFSQTP